MPDETESAVSAWLSNADTKREIAIAKRHLAVIGGDPAQAWILAIAVEILAALNVYEMTTLTEVTDELPEPEDDEPWKRS